jgi:sugar O-acyltransferase (sialic acid O-acetyltransferase NeuD family)
VGLIDSIKPAGDTSFDYPVVGTEAELPTLSKTLNLYGCFIAIGDNWQRHMLAEKIAGLTPDLAFISPVHPSAQIARGATIGRGTVVMPGAIVGSDSKIGDFCIINTKASLDHDCVMEDFSSLAPNATTGGNTTIGAFSAVSMGANVLHQRTIGKHSVIGAGALVLQDVPDFSIAYGVPAVVVKKRQAGDKYL